MKRIHVQCNSSRYTAGHSFAGGGSELLEMVEDHQSNQEPPEDHFRDEEDPPLVHERSHGRHLG